MACIGYSASPFSGWSELNGLIEVRTNNQEGKLKLRNRSMYGQMM